MFFFCHYKNHHLSIFFRFVIVIINLILMSMRHHGCHCDDVFLQNNDIIPDDCQIISSKNLTRKNDDIIRLLCHLRTINSEFDSTNFTAIPSNDRTVISLRVECNASVMTESHIDDRSFAHLTQLSTLEIEFCHVSKWQRRILDGLRHLRALTVRTHHYNCQLLLAQLTFDSDSLMSVRHTLEHLDVSTNDIWTFPVKFFCHLKMLQSLNVSANRLQNVNELNFRENLPNLAMSFFAKNDSCDGLVIELLDVSQNSLAVLPPDGFSALRRLRHLVLARNEIGHVHASALSALQRLELVDFRANRIGTLPTQLFDACRDSIKEIYLQNNTISVLPPGLFTNLTQLVTLDLSNNQLSSAWLSGATFAGLIRLVRLNLSANRLRHLNAAYFTDLYTLQVLNLAFNELSTLPSAIFLSLRNLDTLQLSYNRLTYIDAHAFDGLSALSFLTLDNNLLMSVDLSPEVFRNLTNLLDLNLNSNQFVTVPRAVKKLRLLRTLDLGENHICQLTNDSFTGLGNLHGLRMLGNRLVNVTRPPFGQLTALKILNFAHNLIESIESDAFAAMSMSLQALRLDGNRIQMALPAFDNLENLLWLNLSDNHLTKFDLATLPHRVEWLDLHKNDISDIVDSSPPMKRTLSSLRQIDLSFNRLTRVSAAMLPSSVEMAFFNDNLIDMVDAHAFVHLSNLTRVDLYANQLRTLSMTALRVNVTATTAHFYIGANPFVCDCALEWLQTAPSAVKSLVKDFDSLYCQLPNRREQTEMALLRQVKSTDFLCHYLTHCFALCQCCDFDACDCKMTCPTRCQCLHDELWHVNLVQCTHARLGANLTGVNLPMDVTEVHLDGNDIGYLTGHTFIGRKMLRHIYANASHIDRIDVLTFSGLRQLTLLDLSENRIDSLRGDEFATLHNLQQLYLNGNRLTHVSNLTFVKLTRLQHVRLDGNRLRDIDSLTAIMVENLTHLVHISIAHNPWSCHYFCHADATSVKRWRKFEQWLRAHSAIFDSNLTCQLSNGTERPLWLQVETVSDKKMCQKNVMTTPTGNMDNLSQVNADDKMVNDSKIVFSAISLLLLSIMTVCVGFYYRHELRTWFYVRVRRHLSSSLSTDDIYVIYSAHDMAFVKRQFVPQLKSRKYSVKSKINCQTMTSDIIDDSTRSNKRHHVIILSKEFVENEWSKQKRALKNTAHLIFVRIDINDGVERHLLLLDNDLHLFLTAHPVIRWNDSQFWQKFHFSMQTSPSDGISNDPLLLEAVAPSVSYTLAMRCNGGHLGNRYDAQSAQFGGVRTVRGISPVNVTPMTGMTVQRPFWT